MLLILSYQQPHLIKPQENHLEGGSFFNNHQTLRL